MSYTRWGIDGNIAYSYALVEENKPNDKDSQGEELPGIELSLRAADGYKTHGLVSQFGIESLSLPIIYKYITLGEFAKLVASVSPGYYSSPNFMGLLSPWCPALGKHSVKVRD